MDQHPLLAIELFGMLLVAALFIVIAGTAIQPLSMRLAESVSGHIAADPACGRSRPDDASGLSCLFYQAASARR